LTPRPGTRAALARAVVASGVFAGTVTLVTTSTATPAHAQADIACTQAGITVTCARQEAFLRVSPVRRGRWGAGRRRHGCGADLGVLGLDIETLDTQIFGPVIPPAIWVCPWSQNRDSRRPDRRRATVNIGGSTRHRCFEAMRTWAAIGRTSQRLSVRALTCRSDSKPALNGAGWHRAGHAGDVHG
jgi:hypothetical protein